MDNIKNVKLTIEVLVDVKDLVGSWIDDELKLTKKQILDKIKEEYQDIEILSNNLDMYKVIDVKETKQTKFKY